MIETITKRRMSLNGKSYQKGDTVLMPLQQFEDLEPTGFVARAPKPAPKPKPAAKPKAKPAAKAKTIEPKSDDSTD